MDALWRGRLEGWPRVRACCPWFETARIAAKCTQAAPAMARLLTMRPSWKRVTFSNVRQRQVARSLVVLVDALAPQLFARSEEHTSELQSLRHLVCRLLLEKKKK